MCGIALWAGKRREDRPEIVRMLASLRHRGPDDEGYQLFENAALGNTRLSIIDLEGGRQPIANEDGSMWIVCNGEIYNYPELRRSLQSQGHTFASDSDTEVILHLFEEHGEHCLQKLRGMFSFAIWDEKRGELFVARDRFGQKPLFYVHRESELLVASEIKALLSVDPSLAEMDTEALDQYFALRIIAPPLSMFREIRKLPPAHYMTFNQIDGLNIQRYWTLRYEPKFTAPEEDLLEELENRIIDSIKCHLVSDVPVGAFLSGGLDSTLIVSILMKHLQDEPIPTFSMGLEYGDYDERPYAKMVASRYHTLHRERTLEPTIAEDLPEVVWHLDEPSDPLSVCTFRLAKFASQYVKVALGGDGGDELFAGYDRYYGNRYADYYALVPRVLRKHVIGPALKFLPDGKWYKSRSHQLKWLHQASFLDGGARYSNSLGYFYFNRAQRLALYGNRLRDRSKSYDPEASIRRAFEEAAALNSLDRMLSADSNIRLPDHSVMILDRMTMAHGLEARSPFLDHELAEFCARLPARMKIRGRKLRHSQTRLAERYLPKPVLERPKMGFSSPLPYLLKDEYSLLHDLFLSNSALARDGFLSQTGINGLIFENRNGRADHGNRLWLLLNAEIWYLIHILSTPRQDLTAQITEQKARQG